MKKFILFFVFFSLSCSLTYSQISKRDASFSYAGAGYTLVFFTNSDVTDTYPIFNFRGNEFLSEVNIFYGIKINKSFAVELSPSFIYTSTNGNDGFSYDNRFYITNQADLFSLPININVKFYPFTQDLTSAISNFYIGFGGGPMYFWEEFSNNIYTDSTYSSFIEFQKSKNSFWNENIQFFIGFTSSTRFGYAVELGYRLVPLKGDRDKPQTTSIASNFNSINFTIRGIFSF